MMYATKEYKPESAEHKYERALAVAKRFIGRYLQNGDRPTYNAARAWVTRAIVHGYRR